MPGAIAQNLHIGSRSEILADYLFSTFGTVTPVRRQDDFGVDLFCTLTESIGQRAVVSKYYSVQVKSTSDPWVFENEESIKWLVEYPTPLFLACVDKSLGRLSVYQTLPRFLVGFWDLPSRLELMPSDEDVGQSARWENAEQFLLSAPFLRVTISDLLDKETLKTLRDVLQFWITADRENCTLRRMGLLRFRMPHSYYVNQVPDACNAEQGNVKPTEEQKHKAIRTTIEVLDCVGHQLLTDGDRKSAFCAALLLKYLRKSHTDLFDDVSRMWKKELPLQFERCFASELNSELYPEQSIPSLSSGVDKVIRQLEEISEFVSFAGNQDRESSAP